MHSTPADHSKNAFFRRIVRIILVIAGVAAAYYATGRCLLELGASPNGAVTTIWLPSGITVAAFVRFGPWAAAGSFLGSFGLDLKMGTPAGGGLLVAIANTGSEYLCYRLISGRTNELRTLDKRCVAQMVGGAVLASALSAAIGATGYLIYGVIPPTLYSQILLTWFGSNAIGIVLITPFLICSSEWSVIAFNERRAEYLVTLLALACTAFLWQGPSLPHHAHEPVLLGIILILLMVAFRFPSPAMPPAVFTFAVAAVAGCVLHTRGEAQQTAFVTIFALQIMLGGVAVIGYFLASMVVEQKRANEGLRLAAKVWDTTSEGIMVTDGTGNIMDANSAFERITGYPKAEVLGKHPSFLRSERHPAEFFKAQVRTIRATGEWQGEVWYRRADGTVFPAWLSLSSVRNGRGAVAEYVAILSDITEMREAQTKLLASARHAGMAEIATNMLHNVGNVLNSVNVSAGRLVSQVRDSKVVGVGLAARLIKEHAATLPHFLLHDPKGKLLPDYLEKLSGALRIEQREILEEAERITKSIDHIKDIVATQQSYAGSSTMVEVVQVSSLLEDALRINAESLTRHTVTVQREFDEVPELPLDKARIMMILINLIRNAKHAMAEVRDRQQILTLRLSCAAQGDGQLLRISVQDVGVGIPQEHLTRIFAHGFTTKKEGHGFGLHSCALAASEMGGTLAAESAGPGKGATFTLEVPVRL